MEHTQSNFKKGDTVSIKLKLVIKVNLKTNVVQLLACSFEHSKATKIVSLLYQIRFVLFENL